MFCVALLTTTTKETHLKMGIDAAKNNKPAEAIEHLQRAKEADPKWQLPQLKLANVLAHLTHDYQAAEMAYLEAVQLESNHDAHYFLGVLRQKQLRFCEAAQSFDKALAHQPSSQFALQYRQECVAQSRSQVQMLQEQGRLSEALDVLGQVVDLEPTDATSLFNMGSIRYQLGDSASAAKYFAAAAAVPTAKPSLVSDACFSEGLARRDLGQLDAAHSAYKRALASAPDEASAHRCHFNIGNLMRKAGRVPQAIEHFEAAIALRNRDADSFYQLRRLLKVPHTSTCEVDQPLTQMRKRAISDETFQSLLISVTSHPWTRRSNPLSSSFHGTRGFVVRFNRDGYESHFRSHPQLQALVPFFEATALSSATVFVMNVLVIPAPIAEMSMDPSEGHMELAVKAHLDITGAIMSREASFIAHQVDVLYLQVPSNMRGGRLLVWDPGDATTQTSPREAIQPEPNLWVTFRGDAKHGVEKCCTDSGEGNVRISLVLEQYKVPAHMLGLTTEFDIVGE